MAESDIFDELEIYLEDDDDSMKDPDFNLSNDEDAEMETNDEMSESRWFFYRQQRAVNCSNAMGNEYLIDQRFFASLNSSFVFGKWSHLSVFFLKLIGIQTKSWCIQLVV